MQILLKFIRFPNLVIVALSQYLLRYCLVEQVLKTENSSVFWQNDELNFGLFVGMTVGAAAGGYIINDIIDEKIDAVNKPKKRFVGVYFTQKAAYFHYYFFCIIGFLAAILLSFRSNYAAWIFYYTSASLMLFAYSKWLKKRVFIGNLVVAIFTACVAWGIALPLITTPLADRIPYKISLETLILYCFFAFFSNLWREIIKDLEDLEGDAMHGCRTMPIVWGVQKSKLAANVVSAFLIVLIVFFIKKLLFWYESYHFYTLPSIIWLIACVLFPVSYTIYAQYFAEEKDDFHTISTIIKGIMVGGLLFLLVFRLFVVF